MNLDEPMDEWQWPADCAELRTMENLLRCLICGDFLHGPVLLPCSHAFCSECVRRFLQSKGANGCCPECKQPCSPSDLVANRPMEKVVLQFQQLKPPLLLRLQSGQHMTSTKKKNADDFSALGRKGRKAAAPLERLPLLSYNVMKDKDIKKLLDGIGIRLPIKNREEIIQVHKEYVLLSNAQVDSLNPKTASQLRTEVIQNYRLRQQRNSSKKAATAAAADSPTAAISAEMVSNFEKLTRDIAARKAKAKAAATAANATEKAPAATTTTTLAAPDVQQAETTEGVWRHIYAINSNRELYIHSVTNEIRLERPAELDQVEEGEDDDDTAVATAALDLTASDVEDENKQQDSEVIEIKEDEQQQRGAILPPTPSPAHSNRRISLGGGSVDKRPAASPASKETPFLIVSDEDAESKQNEDEATQSSAHWECPRCTLVNETSSLQCEACGFESRPQRKRQKKMSFQSKILM